MIQYKGVLLVIAAGLMLSAGKAQADNKPAASTTPAASTAASKPVKGDSPTITAMKAAIALEDAGNTGAAIAAFEKIGVLKSKNMEAWRLNDEAHVYLISNQVDKAVPLLEKATESNDANYVAWNNLGSAYEATNQLDKAKDAYQKSVDAAKAANASSAKAEGNLAALEARMNITGGSKDKAEGDDSKPDATGAKK